MADYSYDPLRKRYLTPDGKVISLDTVRALRDRWAEIQGDIARDMAGRVASGEWTLAEFEVAMRAWLGETIGAGYQLGRGGSAMMSMDDAVTLARLISDQSVRVDGLLADYQAGRISDAQFAAWTEQKAGLAVNAYEQGQGRTEGIELPVYPADGETSCREYCRCYWDIEEFDDHWEATWVTVGDELVCPECEERGATYDPYIASK